MIHVRRAAPLVHGLATASRLATLTVLAFVVGLATLALSGCAGRAAVPAGIPAQPPLLPCANAACLRVLTWNLHAIPLLSPSPPARLRNVAAEIRAQQPDLVLLQEVWSHAYASQLERALPEYRLVRGSGCTRPFPCGGLVVLVRHASGWVASAPTFVPYAASAPWYRYREWDGIVKKGVLLLTLARGAATLGVVDTHLQTEYAYLGRDYTEIRREQLAALGRLVHTKFAGRPVVLGGDFNTAPDEHSGLYASQIARLGEDRTVDERAACGCGTRPPGSYRASSRWLDYVITSRLAVHATSTRIRNEWVDRPFSDHDGVLVRLEGQIP